MENLQYTFRNQGLGAYNDDVFNHPSFDLESNEYTFLIQPSLKTTFWRFGVVLSKTKDFRFEPNIGRYNNTDLRFIQINVGEQIKEKEWHLPRRIEFAT
ncbi:MAG TPA: hypothetical protein VI461_05980, partial [Chitinophagaceae bacterium]|nr:hypothetical protein [Chitinophagaceae bacterium]